MRPWLNWIEHLTTDQKVEGSNPSGRARILTAGNGGLIFVQAQDLNPNQGSTTSRFAKRRCRQIVTVAPQPTRLCRARESFWARQNFNRRERRFNFCASPGFEPSGSTTSRFAKRRCRQIVTVAPQPTRLCSARKST